MATPAQIQANQLNAQSSTGPRTAEGKLKAAANSTKHGLSSAFSVLPHEDQDQFTALLHELRGEFEPQTLHQQFLVEQMAKARWRLARIRRVEDALFLKMMDEDDHAEDGDSRIAAALLRNGPNALAVLQRYATAAERSYYKAHLELQISLQETCEEPSASTFDRFLDRLTAPPLRNEPNGVSASGVSTPPTHPLSAPAAPRPTGWRPATGENLALHL